MIPLAESYYYDFAELEAAVGSLQRHLGLFAIKINR
jgi:hypothetical protein